jgi:hypothetical protein
VRVSTSDEVAEPRCAGRGHKAWWFITVLTVGYLVSRGLAKAGSRSSDTDPRTDAHTH